MKKKNKLYTVNRWNKPAFMPARENIFWPGGKFDLSSAAQNYFDGSSAKRTFDMNLGTSMEQQYLDSKNALGISKAANPFSKYNLAQAKEGLVNAGTGVAAAGIGMLGNAAGNAIAGGKTSGIGNAVGSIGSMALGAAGTAIGGPIGGAIGSAVGNVLGGLTNAAFGSELNEEKIAEIENINAQREAENNALYSVNSTDALFDSVGNMTNAANFSQGDIGSDGWFSSDAEDKYEELKAEQERVNRMRGVAIGTATGKVNRNQYINSMKSNLTAFGGPLTRRYGLGGNLFYDGGMSQSDLWKAANDLVVTPKANMTRAQYNYHSAYDGDAAKGFVKAIPGIGDAANAVEAVDNYVNGKANTANTSLTEQAALTGLSNLKVRDLPVGKVASTAYNAGKNILSSLGIFADGGYLFRNGGGTYNEVSNEISPDLAPVVSRDYQPLADQLKQQEAGYNIDDYSYRVQKLHPDITREQVAEAYNNVPVIASGFDNNQLSGSYDTGSKNEENYGHRIMLYGLGKKGANSKNIGGIAGKTLSHEANHLFMDKLLGDKSAEDEKDMLFDAYNPFIFNTQAGDEEMREERATNAGLRKSISQKYGNVTGADLDKAIDDISDQELSDMYFNQNGYVNKEGKKHFKPSAVRKALKTVAYNTDKNPYGVSDTFNITAMGGPLFMNNSRNLFDFGGDLQTHGADWSDGLITIGAGGTHEENKYDGVQLGKDTNSVPNLVEEGETVYDDYVFSNRILADEATKKMFRLPKKKDITFADISKRLEKEIAERPNDIISEAGFKAQMQQLEEQQERQKQEMEAERAKAAFEALSPEEQTALMQQRAEQEAMAEQAAQEQAMAEQQAMQQPSPEEAAMMQADGSEANVGQVPVMAEGGHLFKNGGKELIYKLTGSKTDSEFDEWAKSNKIDQTLDWDAMLKDGAFRGAISRDNLALAHALANDYDFGVYDPSESNRATIKSISRGNWKNTNGIGWLGSDDPAWLEATKGMSDEDIKKLKTEDVAKLLKNTSGYKKGTEWLQNKDNALLYLNTLIDDPGTPDVAKEYARKFVKDGKWKDGFNYDYATVFGSNGKGVRETNPGTYWHTPVEAVRGAQAKNFVIGDDGKVEEIVGDVPTDWAAAGNYSWATPENDMTYNYYRRPAAPEEKPVEEPKPEEPEKDIEPVRKADWLRYAGLFGPAVGLGMQLAGVGKPDYSRLDAAVANAGKVNLAGYKPIGDYLTYRPMDIWYEQNRMDANARATDRAIQNNAGPLGTKMAGLLANGYNNQLASGELYRKALEYNDAKRKDVAEFNRGTNKYNADAYNRNQEFNATALNHGNQFQQGLAMQAAQERLNRDAGWYNSIYGNVGQLFKGISDLGRENRETNWRNALVTSGAMGVVDPDKLVKAKIAKYSAAEGGKLKKKKKGLTY